MTYAGIPNHLGSQMQDLLLVNARVLTMDRAMPAASSVAVRGGFIAAVGNRSQTSAQAGSRARTIDCQGMTLVPGLIDAHCHVLAQASAMRGLDCGPESISSIAGLRELVKTRAESAPPGQWVRGYGYDDMSLIEGRHPNRWDLDQATSLHPVRIDHRSGHASVLNSLGMDLAGIDANTPDSPEGIIDRDESTGQPTGLFFEMPGYLRARLGRMSGEAEVQDGLLRLGETLLRAGVTSVHDAGPDNGLARWQAFQDLYASGLLNFRVTMMAGFPNLGELGDQGLGWNAEDDRLRLGHTKIMVTMTTGALHPAVETLRDMVEDSHRRGFPVAVHAVEQDAVLATALALAEAHPVHGDAVGARDRIEHCSECPPHVVDMVKASGAMVVTQPGLVYWNGRRYIERVDPDLLPHLYPVGSLHRAGVLVAFGSDAPVIDPNPWPGIYSAVTRLTREGQTLNSKDGSQAALQSVSVAEALRMYTITGAAAEGSARQKGSITPGKIADLALLDTDPTRVGPQRLRDIRSVLTILGGREVWNAGV